MTSVSQDKPSKSQGDFSSSQVLHPLPVSQRQQSGDTSDRDLGQEHPSSPPAPAEQAAGEEQEEAASWEEEWGQQLPGRAGQEVQGGDRGTAAGSCPARLAAPRCAETRAAATGREWDTVALVPPTLPTVQRDAGGWKICPHLPLSLF